MYVHNTGNKPEIICSSEELSTESPRGSGVHSSLRISVQKMGLLDQTPRCIGKGPIRKEIRDEIDRPQRANSLAKNILLPCTASTSRAHKIFRMNADRCTLVLLHQDIPSS